MRMLLLIAIGLLAGTLLFAFIAYPPTYVMRVLTLGDSDVADARRFPERPIETGPSTFRFAEAPDEARVRALFKTHAGVADLDALLADTATQAFLVIQHDRILYEKYLGGARRDSVVTSFSEAKSFTSALIGIAIAEGHIRSVNDPITTYLPELAERDPRFGHITIKHLLMMSSGILYREFPFFSGDNAKTYYYPDMRRLALEQTRIAGAPGEQFLYNNYHPLLLGLILERSTGMPVAQYLQEKIWKPLGMEYGASWSLDRPGGFEKMESGINARAIDIAKFGRLFLNGGRWDGATIIPPEWVAESTSEVGPRKEGYYPEKRFFDQLHGYYAYMWWGLPRENGGSDFVAVGNHGQYLYISPAKELIIVRHGAEYGIDTWDWVRIFSQAASGL